MRYEEVKKARVTDSNNLFGLNFETVPKKPVDNRPPWERGVYADYNEISVEAVQPAAELVVEAPSVNIADLELAYLNGVNDYVKSTTPVETSKPFEPKYEKISFDLSSILSNYNTRSYRRPTKTLKYSLNRKLDQVMDVVDEIADEDVKKMVTMAKPEEKLSSDDTSDNLEESTQEE